MFNYGEEASPTKDVIDLFLCDKDTSLSVLNRHPKIKTIFLTYSMALSSSAPVKRLFSEVALVLTAKRSRPSDKLPEYLILLKIHKKL